MIENTTTTAAPDEWRWAVLAALIDHYGFSVDPRGLIGLVPLKPAARRSDAERLLTSYLCYLRAAGWVWFWGAGGPRPGEAVCVLVGPGVIVPLAAPESALRVVGTRVAGPGPGNLAYLAADGTTTIWPAHRARQVGAGATAAAASEAYDEHRVRALDAALSDPAATARPAHNGPRAEPDLRTVHEMAPDAAAWVADREWPPWNALPPRLREAAKVTVYVLEKAFGGQSRGDFTLGNCSPAEMQMILQALQTSGYITRGTTGWQTTWGGRL